MGAEGPPLEPELLELLLLLLLLLLELLLLPPLLLDPPELELLELELLLLALPLVPPLALPLLPLVVPDPPLLVPSPLLLIAPLDDPPPPPAPGCVAVDEPPYGPPSGCSSAPLHADTASADEANTRQMPTPRSEFNSPCLQVAAFLTRPGWNARTKFAVNPADFDCETEFLRGGKR